MSIAIGGGTKDASSTAFASIDWSKGPYFVQTETDVSGGTNYSLSSVSQLLSVPYALTSNNGISRVSVTGDSLVLTNGKTIIIPGISAANPKSNPTSGYGPNISDVDGNSYKTVYIGTQHWMAENLKVYRYNDQTDLKFIMDNAEWENNNLGAYCFYNNDDEFISKYGLLYNWYAISPSSNGNKNVCPTGWHVPTDAEWTVLTDYLGGASVAGSKMKEVSITSWSTDNTDATNTSLFTGLPGGYRYENGSYDWVGTYGSWWSSTVYKVDSAWAHSLRRFNGIVNRYYPIKSNGLSIRCLKD